MDFVASSLVKVARKVGDSGKLAKSFFEVYLCVCVGIC